jgi:autotransporter-associated beta strand protein
MDFATISGVISGGSAGITALTKSGAGNLILSGANTYTGNTALTAGALIVRSIGSAGATSSNLGTNVGGGSLLLGSTAYGGTLLYVGPGEVTTRTIAMAGTTGGPTIDASGSGPVQLDNKVFDVVAQLGWATSAGSCGAASAPLAPPRQPCPLLQAPLSSRESRFRSARPGVLPVPSSVVISSYTGD